MTTLPNPLPGEVEIPNKRVPCYCYRFPDSGRSFCGCTPYPVYPPAVPVPDNFAVMPTAGQYGRFGVARAGECPGNDFELQKAADGTETRQCSYLGGATFNVFQLAN